jgi:hypothetical protein
VIDIANTHMLSPALWAALNEKDLARYLPEEPRHYLQYLHSLNKKRNKSLRLQALEAIHALNDYGIKPLLLKGAIQLFNCIHEDIGSRMMSDLDILVPSQQMSTAVKALTDIGYWEKNKEWFEKQGFHHWAPLVRDDMQGSIELHRAAINRKASETISTQEIWNSAATNFIEGVYFLIPSATHTVLLNILNSQIIDHYHYLKLFNLRSLHDLAAMDAHSSKGIQWEKIRKMMSDQGLTRVLNTHLLAAQRLFHFPTSRDIKISLFDRLHYVLHLAVVRWRLAESIAFEALNFSNPRICNRYGCSPNLFSLCAYRFRYLGYLFLRFGKNRFLASVKY